MNLYLDNDLEYITEQDKKRFYKSKSWQHVRRQALERDNYECQECKKEGKVRTKLRQSDKHKQLDVDHIHEITTRPDLALDLDNLRTLCIRCHNEKHGRIFEPVVKRNKWAHDESW